MVEAVDTLSVVAGTKRQALAGMLAVVKPSAVAVDKLVSAAQQEPDRQIRVVLVADRQNTRAVGSSCFVSVAVLRWNQLNLDILRWNS